MRDIHDWLEAYGESHQNPQNILIHKICVPLITFSILGMLFLIPLDVPFAPYLNVASFICFLILIFYASLSRLFFWGMFLQSLLMLSLIIFLEKYIHPFSLVFYLGLFFVGWVFQFFGHKIEGKKPSFFEDLLFLLIGPLWTLSFLFKKWKIKIK